MKDREELRTKVEEELSKYGLEMDHIKNRVDLIHRWLEKYCSSMEFSVDDPYLDIAQRAIQHAVHEASSFLYKELSEKNLDEDKLIDTWRNSLDSFDMKGLFEDEYMGRIIDDHILGNNDDNYSVNEVLIEENINSQFTDNPQRKHSLTEQLITTYIFRLLEKQKPTKKKNNFQGHDVSLKDKQNSTILILKYLGIQKKIPGIVSAEKAIESKESSFLEFKELKKDIDAL